MFIFIFYNSTASGNGYSIEVFIYFIFDIFLQSLHCIVAEMYKSDLSCDSKQHFAEPAVVAHLASSSLPLWMQLQHHSAVAAAATQRQADTTFY